MSVTLLPPAAGAAGFSASTQKIHVRQITLSHYRNYSVLKQDFTAGRIILTGLNGAGKTNLLEAVSLLSPGRGLRRAAYADIASAGSSAANAGFAVSAQLESSLYGETHIGTAAQPRLGDNPAFSGKAEWGGRRVLINHAPQPAESLSEYCRVIWLIPAQDGLFTGAAGDRRRFLDRLVLAIDSAHARRVADYEKAMRSRNRLLAENCSDYYWLDAVEAQMAALGTAIAAARQELIGRLRAAALPLLNADGFPPAALAVDGLLENRLQKQAAIDAEEFFCQSLRKNREKDRWAGRSLEGPHRSDLAILHKEKNMPAALCSTGEQKALLTGLILSHAHLTAELAAMTPILLLDEIAAHLDARRRAALFAVLENLQAQAFMTGTDKTLFSALKGRADFFDVQDGTLRRAD